MASVIISLAYDLLMGCIKIAIYRLPPDISLSTDKMICCEVKHACIARTCIPKSLCSNKPLHCAVMIWWDVAPCNFIDT